MVVSKRSIAHEQIRRGEGEKKKHGCWLRLVDNFGVDKQGGEQEVGQLRVVEGNMAVT